VEGIERSDYLPLYNELLFDENIDKDIDLVDMSSDLSIIPIIDEDNMVIYESQGY
jgi:hypothetical protein